jgi:hypothetical protein
LLERVTEPDVTNADGNIVSFLQTAAPEAIKAACLHDHTRGKQGPSVRNLLNRMPDARVHEQPALLGSSIPAEQGQVR